MVVIVEDECVYKQSFRPKRIDVLRDLEIQGITINYILQGGECMKVTIEINENDRYFKEWILKKGYTIAQLIKFLDINGFKVKGWIRNE